MFDETGLMSMLVLILLSLPVWAFLLWIVANMPSEAKRHTAYPRMTDFEARQRGLEPTNRRGEGVKEERPG